MLNPISNSLKALETIVQRCKDSPENRYLFDLGRLIEIIQTDALLAGCLFDIKREWQKEKELWNQKLRDIGRQLGEIKQRFKELFPDLVSDSDVIAGKDKDNTFSLSNFDKLGQKIETTIFYPAYPLELPHKTMIAILQEKFEEAEKQSRPLLPALSALAKQKRLLEDAFECLANAGLVMSARSAGHAWEHIVLTMNRIDPQAAESFEELFSINRILRNIRDEHLFRTHLGSPTPEDRAKLKSLKNETDWNVRILGEEISLKLRTRATAEWAIKKYVARTTIYRQREIIERINTYESICRKKRIVRRTEGLLVDDAAAFLFEEGFPVLTERVLAKGQRLDISAGDHAYALLIEAKIYRSPSAALNAISKGIIELHSYCSTIDSSFECPTENFLFLFRLEGTRIAPPSESFDYGNKRFTIVHIDLAKSEERSSKERTLRAISLDDILRKIEEQTKKRSTTPQPKNQIKKKKTKEAIAQGV